MTYEQIAEVGDAIAEIARAGLAAKKHALYKGLTGKVLDDDIERAAHDTAKELKKKHPIEILCVAAEIADNIQNREI